MKAIILETAVETLVPAEVSTREQLTTAATLSVWVKRGMGILPMNHERGDRATPGQLRFLGSCNPF